MAGHREGAPVVRVPVVLPFRLDLTVAALQRVPSNPVETWSGEGSYLRAFETPAGPLIWEVTQDPRRASLALRLHGPVGEVAPWASLGRRMLGCDVDLAKFYEVASGIPVMAQLADRFRGLKPPRFANLWESLVNAIAFQQLSLASGMAAIARLTRRCARPVLFRGAALHPFPRPETVRRLPEAALRACGFSGGKARAFRAAAAAVLDGAVREEDLERLADEQAVERLRELPGVGPWTASVVLLRGLRRLTSFPAGDSGAEKRLRAAFGGVDRAQLLARLGPWKGMLYYHLLLGSRVGPAPSRGAARGAGPRRGRHGTGPAGA